SSSAPTARPTSRASSGASTASDAGCARRRRRPSHTSRRTTSSRSVSRTAIAPPAPAVSCPRTSSSTRSASRRRRWPVPSRPRSAVAGARERRVPLRILGGGSNVVVADAGVDALVVKIGLRGIATREVRGAVEVTAAAGEPWDDFVAFAVAHDWAGLECLSGIPGLVGATPMQNVGAYGQEVSDTVVAVRALDTTSAEAVTLSPAQCGFAYRDSAFKSREPGRYVVLAVTYRLRPGGAPMLGYADVARDVAARGMTAPTHSDVRTSVLAIRRTKSMVLIPGDPNRRSCGSFFTNPIVTPETAQQVAERAGDGGVPRWPQADGGVKLSAAWLLERAGFRRGRREVPV